MFSSILIKLLLSLLKIHALGIYAAAVLNPRGKTRSVRMSDFPKFVQINEEGPREGFQFEKGPIATERKVELIDALSETGLSHIQTVSFVNPQRVPGMADAEEVAARFSRKPGVAYSGL